MRGKLIFSLVLCGAAVFTVANTSSGQCAMCYGVPVSTCHWGPYDEAYSNCGEQGEFCQVWGDCSRFAYLTPAGLALPVARPTAPSDHAASSVRVQSFPTSAAVSETQRNCSGFITALWVSPKEAERLRSVLRTVSV